MDDLPSNKLFRLVLRVENTLLNWFEMNCAEARSKKWAPAQWSPLFSGIGMIGTEV